jgi:ABC-2 type transport system permease protein
MSITAIFLSGFLVPLPYFPDWARSVVAWCPFAGLLQIPIEVLLGKRRGATLLGGLLLQAAWGVLLLLANRLLFALAVRKVTVQGG